MIKVESRKVARRRRHLRIRSRMSGTADKPRLCVFRSNRYIYAQIIDDVVGHTLVSASTLEKSVSSNLKKACNLEAASFLGGEIARRALEKNIGTVSDRHTSISWARQCFSIKRL